MFWNRIAGVYDLFAFYNRKAHKELCERIAAMIASTDEVLECACGTGMLSVYIASRCRKLIATDFARNMLKIAEKKCAAYANVEFDVADILCLDYPNEMFDKVVAANVIHLLDDPHKALKELGRVCRSGGKMIIPTYMGKENREKSKPLTKAIGKAGANFKRQFTYADYRRFFADAGYGDVEYIFIEGRVPCAVAVVTKTM